MTSIYTHCQVSLGNPDKMSGQSDGLFTAPPKLGEHIQPVLSD